MASKPRSRKKDGITRRTAVARDALHRSNEWYRVLAEEAPVLIWVNGLDGAEFVNPAYLEFLGVSGQIDIQRFDWARYVHPDDREAYLNAYLDCFQRQAPFETVFRFRRHDGVYRWMKSVGRPRYIDGMFQGYVGSTQDITEQKVMEDELRKAGDSLEMTMEQRTAELRESEAKYRTIVETANEGIWMIGLDARTTFVNDRMARMLGYTPGEMLGKKIGDFMDDSERALTQLELDRHFKGAKLQRDSQLHRKDGSYIWCIVSATPILDETGDITGGIVMITDITERKRAEEALKNSEEKFRALADASPAIILFHQGDKHLYVNAATEAITGYSHDELLNMDFWGFIAPEDRDVVKARGLSRLQGENPPLHYPVKILTRQGGEKWIEIAAARMEYRGQPAIMVTAQDITERKLAEEKISHLASFPSLDPSPVIETDLEGNPSYMNPSAIKAFPDLNEKGAAHPMLSGLKAVADELGAQKKNYIFREVVVGDSFFQETIHKVPDKMALRIYALDITERKQAENTVRKSDLRFRSLIQNSSDIIRILDNEGRIIFDSPSSEKILGYPPGYTLGKFPFDFMHPDDINFVQKELGTVYDNRNSGIPIEFRIRKADGEYLWVESTGVNMTGVPGVDGIVITTRPIGERKRAEEALRKNEEMLRRIIDSSPVPIALHEENGKVIYINKKFTGTFGYTIEDVPSLNEWWTLAYPDKEYREFVKKRWDSAIDHAIKNIVSIPPREVEVTCKDGSKRQILSEFSSIGSVNMSVLYDITERKRSEEELKGAKQQADLYLDLMGHDISNLHQIALGYLELAKDMPAGTEQAVFLDKSVEVLQRSSQLIQNVRKLQKLHDGLFKSGLVNVCEVISDVQREFGAVPNKLVVLNFNGRERCFVLANELLHDVIANLVSNAIKHTGDRAEIVIDLDVINDHDSRYCRVFVEDNGPGIPDGFKAKVFDRTLKSTNNAKGMGLGLYLVKSLVDSYGGRVWVEDRIFGDHTKGARFVVMLPAIEKR